MDISAGCITLMAVASSKPQRHLIRAKAAADYSIAMASYWVCLPSNPKRAARSFSPYRSIWLQKLMQASAIEFEGMKKTEAFWERLPDDQPPFMRAIAREATEDWNGLFLYAVQWTKEDALNPEPWVALGKSLYHLKRHPDAVAALKKATELEPNHAQAWLYLARSYRNIGDKNALSIAEEKLAQLDAAAAKSFSIESAR